MNSIDAANEERTQQILDAGSRPRMIVIDASAWVDLAIGEATPGLVGAATTNGHWLVPEHFRLEGLNAIRGRWLGRQINDLQFDALTAELMASDLDAWPTAPLMPRVRHLPRTQMHTMARISR